MTGRVKLNTDWCYHKAKDSAAGGLVWDLKRRVLDLFRCMRCRGGRVMGYDPWSETGVGKEY